MHPRSTLDRPRAAICSPGEAERYVPEGGMYRVVFVREGRRVPCEPFAWLGESDGDTDHVASHRQGTGPAVCTGLYWICISRPAQIPGKQAVAETLLQCSARPSTPPSSWFSLWKTLGLCLSGSRVHKPGVAGSSPAAAIGVIASRELKKPKPPTPPADLMFIGRPKRCPVRTLRARRRADACSPEDQ
jgi:hypothetical protein